jgi:hypothetical protein
MTYRTGSSAGTDSIDSRRDRGSSAGLWGAGALRGEGMNVTVSIRGLRAQQMSLEGSSSLWSSESKVELQVVQHCTACCVFFKTRPAVESLCVQQEYFVQQSHCLASGHNGPSGQLVDGLERRAACRGEACLRGIHVCGSHRRRLLLQLGIDFLPSLGQLRVDLASAGSGIGRPAIHGSGIGRPAIQRGQPAISLEGLRY